MTILFDESYYLESKARQLNKSLGTTWDGASVKAAFANAGLTPETHYNRYGAFEVGVNPSASFDDELYYYNKSKQLNVGAQVGGGDWSLDEVADFFKNAGISALGHYHTYGKNENIPISNSQTPTLHDTTQNGNIIAGALTSEYSTFNEVKGTGTLLYNFMVTKDDPGPNGPFSDLQNFIQMDDQQRKSVRSALDEVTRVTGILFAETNDASQANMYFGTGDLRGTFQGQATYPNFNYNFNRLSSIVFIDNDQYRSMDPVTDGYWYQVLLHEVGHAMTLKHPFEGPITLPTADDNTSNTLMSYTHSGNEPYTTFRSYDVLTLQYIYGQDGLGGMGSTTWA